MGSWEVQRKWDTRGSEEFHRLLWGGSWGSEGFQGMDEEWEEGEEDEEETSHSARRCPVTERAALLRAPDPSSAACSSRDGSHTDEAIPLPVA